MLKKLKNGHYTTCNSQVSQYNKHSKRLMLGHSCNCVELAIEDAKQNFHSTAAPIFKSPMMGSWYATSAMPINLATGFDLATQMYERVSHSKGEDEDFINEKKYSKNITYFDIFESAIEGIYKNLHFFPYYYDNIDIWSSFNFYYESIIEISIKRYPSLLNRPKPEMKLVKIGMDVDLRHLSSTSFVIKPLQRQHFNGHTLSKGSFWVISELISNTPPFYLFEFPINDTIQPKTDLVLLVDPYIPEDDYLTEEVYHAYGIKLMKKFDIKDARLLLDKRKLVFNSAPTATNTILLFQLMDALVLNDFKTGALDLNRTGERNLIRLEKLKNLALDTKFNEERKSAVDKAFMQFEIICSKKEEKVG